LRNTPACLAILALLLPARLEARCPAPWQRLDAGARELARPLPLALLGASALPPLALAPSGADHELRFFAQTDLGGSYDPEPVSFWVPYAAGAGALVTWTAQALAGSCEGRKAPTAILQGMAAALVLTTLTKWATGRAWPNGGRDPRAPDRLAHPEDATRFEPLSAVVTAFPSGHTAVMFAGAAALRASSPELGAARFAGYPLAAAVGFAMWWGDHHWASDVLSGALAGEAVGGAAGRAWGDGEPKSSAWTLAPFPGGLLLAKTF
jgi:membrane-associated phospholipid phosphatase